MYSRYSTRQRNNLLRVNAIYGALFAYDTAYFPGQLFGVTYFLMRSQRQPFQNLLACVKARRCKFISPDLRLSEFFSIPTNALTENSKNKRH